MRFPVIFKRGVNTAGLTVLGSDATPTIARDQSADCVIRCRLTNINGFPVQRVVVGYTGPGGALALTFNAYLWEEQSQAWYKLNASATSIAPNTFATVDTMCLADNPATGISNIQSSGPGGLEVFIKVVAAGSDPDGVYTFVVGSDVSNPGV